MSSVGKSLRVLPSFHTGRELNLIAFRVIFSSYTLNQNILMRTIVLTNLLIKLLFSFNSLLLKKKTQKGQQWILQLLARKVWPLTYNHRLVREYSSFQSDPLNHCA